MNTGEPLDRCMHGVLDCGGAPAWSERVQWLKPLEDDSTHEECDNDPGGEHHSWWYSPTGGRTKGCFWICCGCSDMLREYGTLTFLIEELPV